MSKVQQLSVKWYDGRLIGTLANPGTVYFAYSEMLVGGVVAGALRDHPGAILGILKLDQGGALSRSTDGRVEHAYMQMAGAAGIRAANTRILAEARDGQKHHHLFVERFDVDAKAGRRRHLVTLAGMLETFSLDYGKLLLATQRLTHDHSQVLEAVRRMIFNVRMVNADDHGKNHSFMLEDVGGPPGLWTLSPAYDLTFNGQSSGDYNGLSTGTFGRTPNLSALSARALDAGLTVAEFEKLDSEVAAVVDRWNEFADRAGLTNAESAQVQEALTLRANLLRSTAPNQTSKRRRRRIWET